MLQLRKYIDGKHLESNNHEAILEWLLNVSEVSYRTDGTGGKSNPIFKWRIGTIWSEVFYEKGICLSWKVLFGNKNAKNLD